MPHIGFASLNISLYLYKVPIFPRGVVMVYRSNNKGTLMIDRKFGHIGRIQKASGTNDKKTFKAIVAMLDELWSTGKHPILKEIKRGIVSPLEVYSFFSQGRLDHLPSAATLRPIIPTIYDFIDQHNIADYTKKRYKDELRKFAAVVGNIRISDLPTAVKKYRKHCSKKNTHKTFNHAKAVITSYLSNTLGKSHILWQQVTDVKRLKEQKKINGIHLSVPEAEELFDALPTEYAEMAEALCVTGMMWKEYAVDGWTIKKDRIHIKGVKRTGRDRIVPLIQKIEKPTRGILAFRKAIKKVRSDIKVGDFRKTYLFWLSESEIPRNRRRLYMGHGNTDTTDIYEPKQVKAFLNKDAEKIRDWILKQRVDATIRETFDIVDEEGETTSIFK